MNTPVLSEQDRANLRAAIVLATHDDELLAFMIAVLKLKRGKYVQ